MRLFGAKLTAWEPPLRSGSGRSLSLACGAEACGHLTLACPALALESAPHGRHVKSPMFGCSFHVVSCLLSLEGSKTARERGSQKGPRYQTSRIEQDSPTSGLDETGSNRQEELPSAWRFVAQASLETCCCQCGLKGGSQWTDPTDAISTHSSSPLFNPCYY
jgi:hypothetical protein